MKKKTKKQMLDNKSGRLLFAALIAVFVIAGSVAAINLILIETRNNAAQSEYDELRQFAPAINQSPASDSSAGPGNNEPTNPTADDPESEQLPETAPDLSAINPDYIGWIRINGTNIDYPVVQGTNNTKYLNTTFMGERNPSGTIFMDHECTEGFTGLAILHGHNMRNGSMFAGLHQFRDRDFRSEHNVITIFKPDGEILTFTIFDVIVTDINDPVFSLPVEGQQAFTEYFNKYDLVGHFVRDRAGILILSTCTEGHKNERLIILAARQ